MAVRKASDSNLTGKKYNDASAGTTKVADVPDAPTIGAVTGSKPPVVAFTPSNRGGTANSFTVTSTPGSVTATGSSSPITMNGLTVGTTYTFKVKGKNNIDRFGEESGASSSVEVTGYALAQTYNSSATYTVPAGVTKIGVVTISGGQGGSGGGQAGQSGSGGTGGRSGSAVSFFDYDVSSGQNYTVTVAASGGTSSFGNLTSAAAGGNASGNYATNRVVVNSVAGGGPDGGGFGTFGSGTGFPGQQSASITYNIPDIGPITIGHSGGGGGGGRGGGQPNQQPAKGGGGGGATFGGGGGGGGNWNGQDEGNGGGGGGGGNGPGGGGGGGGAGAMNAGGGPGGAGAAGRILVYEARG
jgi:hypothetical protein